MAAGDIILEIDHLSAGYTDEPVVVDFSAAILEGTVTTVIGPNGAGKSTLLRAVYGLIRHFAGSVRFRGQAIERLPPRERLTRGIGLVPQGRCNFPAKKSYGRRSRAETSPRGSFSIPAPSNAALG